MLADVSGIYTGMMCWTMALRFQQLIRIACSKLSTGMKRVLNETRKIAYMNWVISIAVASSLKPIPIKHLSFTGMLMKLSEMSLCKAITPIMTAMLNRRRCCCRNGCRYSYNLIRGCAAVRGYDALQLFSHFYLLRL